ncbi:MAG: Uma2 family endonuclease [Synechococcaceae cyanobacterium]
MLAPPAPGLSSPDLPFASLTLPLICTPGLRLTPEQFAQVCEANPEAVLELAADGSLIAMTPTGSDIGARNGESFFQINSWVRSSGGWIAFDSSTGFRLPDDSVLSPDVALVALERWNALSDGQRRGFAPLSPTPSPQTALPLLA